MMKVIRLRKPLCGVAIALQVVLAGCGWSGYPDAGATNPCTFADGRPLAGAAELGSLPIGCSNAANLGAMVADANDVERGKALAPADGERAALGVAAYQAGLGKGAVAASSITGPVPPAGIATGSGQ